MHDYMQALQQRFFRKSQCEELRQTVEETCKELFARMGDEDKRKLRWYVVWLTGGDNHARLYAGTAAEIFPEASM